MKKITLLIVLCMLFLSGCSFDGFPCVRYIHSGYNFDSSDRDIEVINGYILNQGHSYDIVETEDGYDLILHFVKDEE